MSTLPIDFNVHYPSDTALYRYLKEKKNHGISLSDTRNFMGLIERFQEKVEKARKADSDLDMGDYLGLFNTMVREKFKETGYVKANAVEILKHVVVDHQELAFKD